MKRNILGEWVPNNSLVVIALALLSSLVGFSDGLMSGRRLLRTSDLLWRQRFHNHQLWKVHASASGSIAKMSSKPPPQHPQSNPLDVSMTEIELSLTDGMVLRGQRWSSPEQHSQTQYSANDNQQTTKILALHGWLDNCRSFHYLAPRLIQKLHESPEMPRAELVAVDLPGHGLSSHRPIDGPTTVLSEGAYYIAEIIDALGWDAQSNADTTKTNNSSRSSNDTKFNDDNQVALIGHSMGGGMAVTYAGIFPEQISRVVSLDMFGPEPGTSGQTASDIRSHVLQRRSLGPYGRPHALYKSLDRAIERRQKAATMAPGGRQYLSKEAATELVTRSMKPVHETSSVDDENKAIIKGYRFTHDPRLLWPSLQYLTAEQIQSILEGVECPVCILAAQDGYPFAQDRIDRTVEALEPDIYEILPGSHHLHADPDTADAVVDRVYDFFCRGGRGGSSHGRRKQGHEAVARYGMQ